MTAEDFVCTYCGATPGHPCVTKGLEIRYQPHMARRPSTKIVQTESQADIKKRLKGKHIIGIF